jgi:hypothetical protein
LLTDEYSSIVRGRLELTDFADATAIKLMEALLPLLDGKYAPAEAIAQLTDVGLVDYANAVLMDVDEQPLTEALIEGCLQKLNRRRAQEKLRESRSDVLTAEGNGTPADESLRRWEQKARAMKAPDAADAGTKGRGSA